MGRKGGRKRSRSVGRFHKAAMKQGAPGRQSAEEWQAQVKAFRTAAREAGWAEERITTTMAQGRSAVIAALTDLE